MTFPVPNNEDRRLAALRAYEILDTAPERDFDDIVSLASNYCETPTALISLLDDQRQWFKARIGLDAESTPREFAFCNYAISKPQTLIVADASQDDRFSQNPLVTDGPHIRFYAGSPLINDEGLALGTLCVIDSKPRELTPRQIESLEALGRIAMRQIETRRVNKLLADALANIHTLQGLLPICSFCKNIRADDGYWKRIETYVIEHSDATFSHGICPDCLKKNFPEYEQEIKN